MPDERQKALKELSKLFSKIKTEAEWKKFLEDFFSPSELLQFEERWLIAAKLLDGSTQRHVAESLGVSISKVTRGAQVLKFGQGSFQNLKKKLQ